MHFGKKNKEGKRGELWLDAATGEIVIDGSPLLASEWQSLNKRVEACFRRTGIIKNPKPAPTPVASRFIIDNLAALNKVERGKVKNAPFPLSLFYDAVITKEELKGKQKG